jgi:hypothetical protein
MRTPHRHLAGKFDLGFVLRGMVACLLWIALLVWSVPKISAYISLHGLTYPKTLLGHVIPWYEGQSGTATHTVPPGTAKLQFWQVGLQASAEDTDSIGARTTIETRVPQEVSQDTTNYFWVGAYLRDDSFIQAGYYVPWNDSSRAGWFYCAFHPNGREGPCVYGALGSAGNNQTRHTYTIEAMGGTGSQPYWQVWQDSRVLGRFEWSANDTGPNVAMIYAESSGSSPHPGTSRLGPVDFVGGLEVLPKDERTYRPAAHLIVMYSAPLVCPPYGIRLDGQGGILLGSGLPCPTPYTTLL